MSQIPRSRIDLLPHYSRLIATLNKYLPDIGNDIVTFVRVTHALTNGNVLRLYFSDSV